MREFKDDYLLQRVEIKYSCLFWVRPLTPGPPVSDENIISWRWWNSAKRRPGENKQMLTPLIKKEQCLTINQILSCAWRIFCISPSDFKIKEQTGRKRCTL